MTTRPRLPHTLTGAADRCCPKGLCDYRVEAVELYLAMIEAFERSGEDPCETAASKPLDRCGRGGTDGDGPIRTWDIQQAIVALRREGKAVTATAIAARLCPWALES